VIAAGLDIGSVATKAVLLRDGRPAAHTLLRTGPAPAAAAREALARAAAEAGFGPADVGRVAATGYGRRSIDFADRIVTEITAGARGAHHLGCPWGAPRLLVDLGGQDMKVTLLDPDGSVRDFAMNDRCAAGTGRFLEVMAGVLNVPLEELADLGARSDRPADIRASCTVFAESEVISLISRGTPKEDIVAGLHAAVASHVAAMVRPLGPRDAFFHGGGAWNGGVRAALGRRLGRRVHVPPRPQHVVALGAALTAARDPARP